MTRTNPYPMNDPRDYSMLTTPKLKIGDIVIVWDEDEGGEWVQSRVVDATFNRGKKCWEYSAVVEFVDEYFEQLPGGTPGSVIETKGILVKDWHCFSDEELDFPIVEEWIKETKGIG